jgi:hypothetical protein
MMIRWDRFNLYLSLLLTVAMLGGCRTELGKREHQPTIFRVHQEVHPDGTSASEPVPIYRLKPVMVNVGREPFLSELNVSGAKVIDVIGGFAISVQFDRQGTWQLEEHSIQSRGRRAAIHCQFGKNLKEARWLAAPVISRRISDGVLTFTPDATREEADEIVLGLNNIARGVKKKEAW